MIVVERRVLFRIFFCYETTVISATVIDNDNLGFYPFYGGFRRIKAFGEPLAGIIDRDDDA